MTDAIGQFRSAAPPGNLYEYLRNRVSEKFPMSSGTGRVEPSEHQRIANALSGVATDLQTAIDS